MPEYLTTDEFTRWAESFDRKLNEITDIRKDTIQNTIDVGIVKASCARSKSVNGTISAIVAGITSALVTFGASR
jgi:phenylacetate-coenzyme A ligase PaaK-like adenylate-forming protein